jgi:hypothetical protein
LSENVLARSSSIFLKFGKLPKTGVNAIKTPPKMGGVGGGVRGI